MTGQAGTGVFDAAFGGIGLAELNARAEMLTRLDNKYTVSEGQLDGIVAALADRFDILDIGGKRRFGYETCYFDCDALQSYYHHVQGRRRRCKVRIRNYLDAKDLCFVEVKLKDRRGITVKKRIGHRPDQMHDLGETGRAHVESSYQALYGQAFGASLRPVIKMRYQRMTLVARDGGERMTIDTGLQVWDDHGIVAMADGMFILEAKSERGRGSADRILRQAGLHPVNSCSKYCVGLAALGRVDRHNRFIPAMRRLGMTPDQRLDIRSASPLFA